MAWQRRCRPCWRRIRTAARYFAFVGAVVTCSKILVWDGQGLVLVAKRLEKGRFVWPQATSGVVSLTPAMLSMLLEGIDWRMPAWTARPESVG